MAGLTIVGTCSSSSVAKDDGIISTSQKDTSVSSQSSTQYQRTEKRPLILGDSTDYAHPDDGQDTLIKASKTVFYDGNSSNGPDYVDEDKKASNFVRIGKMFPMNRFIRIGRLFDESGFRDPTEEEMFDDNYDDKRSSQFLRIGRNLENLARDGTSRTDTDKENSDTDKRPSNFVRVGKTSEPSSDQIGASSENIKMASQFVRIGKVPSSFVRIGKSPSSFVRIGKSPSSFLRIGKSPSSFVRIGKEPSHFVRIGKSDLFNTETSIRNSADSPEESDYSIKRASSFVRIGKDDFSKVETPKNENSKASEETPDEEKRTSSFVRIGKAQKSSDDIEEKRASSFLRIGRSDPDRDLATDLTKRASTFVRFGKPFSPDSTQWSLSSPASSASASLENLADGSVLDSQEPIRISSRGSAFVRIGKIPSSAFVRIGKNTNLLLGPTDYGRSSRGSQSSFVRIGK